MVEIVSECQRTHFKVDSIKCLRWGLMPTKYQHLHFMCEQVLFLLEINRFLELLFEFAFWKTPCFLILDPLSLILDPGFLHLATRMSRRSRCEYCRIVQIVNCNVL